MDLDIEMGDASELSQDPLFAAQLPRADDILQVGEPEEPGEVSEDGAPLDDGEDGKNEPNMLASNKIHIRGLDTLHTDDVRAYVGAHFGAVDRIEWIDDASANLVFSSSSTAREAITALSSIQVADASALAVGESLPAKPLAGKPEISLQVRFALQSDRKQAGAALRSRYYLLHPEHDPEERRRRQLEQRSRYRNRDDRHRRDSRSRRNSDDDSAVVYDASMYDDAPRPSRPMPSGSEGNRIGSASESNRGKELFADRKALSRHRSASPPRRQAGRGSDADSDHGGSYLDHSRIKAPSRSNRRPPHSSSAAANIVKELFPGKSLGKGAHLDQLENSIGSAGLRDEDIPKVVAVSESTDSDVLKIRGRASRRLEPDVESTANFTIKGAAKANTRARELFPAKLNQELVQASRSKARQKAHDLFS